MRWDIISTMTAFRRPLTLGQKLRIFFSAAFHRKTPITAKLLLGGGLLYGIVPLDLIPDLLPIIGIADDATVLVIAVLIFLQMTKRIRKELE